MPLDRIDGEIVFDIDINAMEQALKGTGSTTGWAVTPVTGQLKVSVAEGSGRSEGTVKSTTGATEVALNAADATHPRKDLIVYDVSASALGKVTGIPAAIDPAGTVNPRKMKVPKPPDLGESTDIIIASVYIPANCTNADECTIIDKRVALPFGSDISDADAIIGDVKDEKTFYATDYPKKTGTLALDGNAVVGDVKDGKTFYKDSWVKKTGTLALDGNAAVEDVRDGKTFYKDSWVKKTGTLVLAADVAGSASSSTVVLTPGGSYHQRNLEAYEEVDLTSKILTFAPNSRAVAVGFASCAAVANSMKLRLYMDEELVAESSYIPTTTSSVIVIGAKELSGTKTCRLSVRNYLDSSRYFRTAAVSVGDLEGVAIAVVSMKI